MNYFDYSATTQPDPAVMESYLQVANDYFANPSSAHQLGQASHQLLCQARAQVAELLQFNPDEIYFASSGTEVNNWILQAIVDEVHAASPDRNRLIISAIEHPSISRQIPLLQEKGYQVDLCPVLADGCVDLEALSRLLGKDVLLISIMTVNNEVGAVQPIDEIGRLLQNYPQIIWHTDAVQATTCHLHLLHHPRIDLVTLSAHKFHAPRGAGVLAKRHRVSSKPILYGGGQEKGLRSSTENLAAIVAMAKALRLTMQNQASNQSKLSQFRQEIMATLATNQWQIFAQESGSPHIICAALPPVPGEVLVHAFEENQVYISTTSACSSRKHQNHSTLSAMGVDTSISQSAIRISMSATTTQDQVTALCQTIQTVSQNLLK
ncbi:cysteine desulfurase family protein [Vaginisenegalia massiliensis]|uniref:cysteine desulfurase family protein n=1 Tax=Vaginisenegalia massiliensis TaxID=2058294 RepID=UPI000F5477CD|nr:cysteine desulfurase family protein [Vaginisenegalia massiliensis]